MTETVTTAEEPLITRTEGGVLTLTLNRPDALNRLTPVMMDGLRAGLKRAAGDPLVRVVVITGAGRAFCAGADLEELKKACREGAEPSLGGELRKRFIPLVQQIRRMEKPVVGAVNGLAAGAGASLILCCDIKICSATAKFVADFIRLGLVPDPGFTYLCARSLGFSRTLEHAWTAKPIQATVAEHFGLVNKVVPSDELALAVKATVDELLKAPPRAVALTKRAVNRALENTFDDQLDYDAHLQEVLGRTEDHREGVAAFVEDRPPKFTGE
ncbi:MAG: enoyl-CoA hydratase-related protein [Elusimicrobiota bacterium]